MRGADTFTESLFTRQRLDDFVPQAHPLRAIRTMANQPLAKMDRLFAGMYEADTSAEFHPTGTSYWSDDAPIAPLDFPYDRSDVWECAARHRLFLRYAEGGGYFVDQRIRVLSPSLLVDAALP